MLQLHGPATILQVVPGWVPPFLAFFGIAGHFLQVSAIPGCILVQRKGPGCCSDQDPSRAAPVWGIGPVGAGAGPGGGMVAGSCGIWCPGNAVETCHATVCLRQMEADRLFPNELFMGWEPHGWSQRPGSGSPDLLQRDPGRREQREDQLSQRGNLPAAGCKGCRAPVLPPNAFSKAAGSH